MPSRDPALYYLTLLRGSGVALPPPSWATPAWYVDPIHGTNSNAGTSPETPVQTVMGGIVPKWGTNAPILSQPTTITFLNSETPGQESIVLDIACALPNGNLFLSGSYIPQGAPTTIATLTPKNRTTGTLLAITMAAPPAGLAPGLFIHNTTRGSRAVIYENESGTLVLTQPLLVHPLGSGSGTPVEDDTWSDGDAVLIESVPAINLTSLRLTSSANAFSGPTIQALSFIGTSFYSQVDASGIEVPFFYDCTFGNVLLFRGSYYGTFCGCYSPNGYIFDGSAEIYGGYVNAIESNWQNGYTVLDLDVILGSIATCDGVQFGFVYFVNTSTVAFNSAWFCYHGILYGPGSLLCTTGGSVYFHGSGVAGQLLLTGVITLGGNTTGTTYAAGTWTDGRALTGANVDTYGALIDPVSGCRLAKA
jgi:hypothetical protein